MDKTVVNVNSTMYMDPWTLEIRNSGIRRVVPPSDARRNMHYVAYFISIDDDGFEGYEEQRVE